MPEPNIVEPPRRHASAIRSRLTLVVPGDERRRRDAGFQDAHQFVDVDPHRVVDDDVRLQRQQRVDVVGGGDAERLDTAELTDLAADLVI